MILDKKLFAVSVLLTLEISDYCRDFSPHPALSLRARVWVRVFRCGSAEL
jgi:hypothetical protein